MRVAVVHDWLYTIGGAGRVLQQILVCYPQADVFTLFDLLSAEDRARIGLGATHTSFMQTLPFIRQQHRSYLPVMPLAVEQFDMSDYDLIISSSFAVAKGVLTGPDQVHVSYIHSPMRYAWDLQHVYLRESGYERGFRGAIARMILHRMRVWDTRTAHGPNEIAANSQFVARRIKKAHGRDARVIYPPVRISPQMSSEPRGDYFFAASRLVPYKNIDRIVEAFADMPDLCLIVAGSGPESARLRKMATSNVTFTGYVADAEMKSLMAGARAFVFAAEEDFGIIMVEALAEGTPVLALGRGGAREIVSTDEAAPTGMFFPRATRGDIAACVRRFTEIEDRFLRADCRRRAEFFSEQRFRSELLRLVDGVTLACDWSEDLEQSYTKLTPSEA